MLWQRGGGIWTEIPSFLVSLKLAWWSMKQPEGTGAQELAKLVACSCAEDCVLIGDNGAVFTSTLTTLFKKNRVFFQ